MGTRRYVWNREKNEWLMAERGVSFGDVVNAMDAGELLDTIDHPNLQKYPDQKMFIVKIREYAYLVPFVVREQEVHLMTIIPNRKATRVYLRRKAK